jgi:phosphatidylserine/phosphatidylglycerophosphate/cardiolipin synthase-like enzyme
MQMTTVSAAGGDISVAFLQQNGDDPFKVTPERTAQIAGVAKLIADFIAGARKSLDIAIYDFRLGGDAAATITAALHERARNNVAIRVIYDSTTEPNGNGNGDGEIVPAHLEADRKSPGTETFVNSFADIAQIKPVTGYRVLMHSKYLIRDADSDAAAVFLGSANYTNDSWGLQESNLLQIRSRPLAAIFTDNFVGLFATGRISVNQTNRDVDSVDISGVPVKVGFAPKQSPAIVKEIVGAIASARERLFVASGVVSSGPILAALSEAIDRGMRLGGLYDGPQMDLVRRQWRAAHVGADKINTWDKVADHLVRKNSIPYNRNRPQQPHNFMHNKLVIADDLVVTGSFNLSNHAMGNAEDVLFIHDAGIASAYTTYLEQLEVRYSHFVHPQRR